MSYPPPPPPGPPPPPLGGVAGGCDFVTQLLKFSDAAAGACERLADTSQPMSPQQEVTTAQEGVDALQNIARIAGPPTRGPAAGRPTTPVDQVVDVNGVDTTLLVAAVRGGRIAAVEHLLRAHQASADLSDEARVKVGTTPLLIAIENTNVALATALVAAINDRAAALKRKNRNGKDAADLISDLLDTNPLKQALAKILFGTITGALTLAVEDEALKLADSPEACGPGAERLQQLLATYPQLATLETVREDDQPTTLLYSAARSNNAAAIVALIAAGANPNQALSLSGNTPLHVAAYRGHVAALEELVRGPTPPDIFARNKLGEAPGSAFATGTPRDVVRSIRGMLQLPHAALLRAVEHETLSVLEKFVQAFPADAAVEDRAAGTPSGRGTLLHKAIRDGRLRIVEFLLRHGAGPNYTGGKLAVDAKGSSGAQAAPASVTPAAPARGRVVDYGDDDAAGTAQQAEDTSVARQSELAPPLVAACAAVPNVGESVAGRIIDLLIEFGADANTARTYLIMRDETQAVELLRKHAPALKLDDEHAVEYVRTGDERLRPYFDACVNKAIDARVPASDTTGSLPLLTHAVRQKKLELVRELLNRGASPAALGVYGESPLHHAVYGNDAAMVTALLQTGACDVNIRDSNNQTPVDVARGGGNMVITQMLEAHIAAQVSENRLDELRAYTLTLPQRPAAGAHSVQAASLRSPDDLVAAATRALHEEARTCVQGFAIGPADNPLSRELCNAAVDALTSSSNPQVTFESIVAVPAPGFLPVDPRIAILEVAAELWRDPAFKSRVLGPLPPVVAGEVPWDTSVSPPTVVKASASTFVGLREACKSHIDAAIRNGTLTALARSCYLEALEGQWADELLTASRVSAKGCLVAACYEADPVSVLEISADIVRRYTTALGPWPHLKSTPHDQLYTSWTASCQRKNLTGKKLLELLDAAIPAFVAEVTAAVGEAFVDQKLPADVNGTAVIVEYVNECGVALARECASLLTARPTVTVPETAKADGGIVPQLPTQAGFEERFCDFNNLTSWLAAAEKRPAPSGATVTQRNQQAFENAVFEMRQTLAPGLTPHAIASGVLRNLHLHDVWRTMQIYEHLGTAQQSLDTADVLLVEADTGSGKSLVLPQFLAHAGRSTMITMPRRNPVLETGKYAATMYGESHVGYCVGGTQNPSPKGRLQYRTDSLFLNTLTPNDANPPEVLIIDEAHERTATMEALYLVYISRIVECKQSGARPPKIVLASATVDATHFRQMAQQSGLQFQHLRVTVERKYQVTVKAPSVPLSLASGTAATASGTAATQARERVDRAVDEAYAIVKKNPGSTKVLVFLPHKKELIDAQRRFDGTCGGSVSSAVLHATAENMQQSLKRAQVLFANQVAETSLTIDKLTHVLDFNMTMAAEIDRERDCRVLDYTYITSGAQVQRMGRLGRRCDGEYRHYYDLSLLPSAPKNCGFDLLLNDELLAMEIKVRHLTRRSLLAGAASGGLTVIGNGIDAQHLPVYLLPTSLQAMTRAGVLGLSGSMSAALEHTLTRQSCPTAVLWLASIIGSRDWVTAGGAQVQASHKDRFGDHGDLGILLDLVHKYMQEKARHGKKFDGRRWAQGKQLNPYFFENVAARIDSVLTTAMGLGIPIAKSYADWRWADIEDAMLAGLGHHAAFRVKSRCRDLSLYIKGPYQSMDSLQTCGLDIINTSVFYNASVAQLPDYVVYTHLEKRDKQGRRFLTNLVGVSEAAVQRRLASAAPITQVIGLAGPVARAYDTQAVGGTTLPSCVHKETNEANFSPALRARAGKGLQFTRVEFVVSGPAQEVAKAIDKIAEVIEEAINRQNAISSGHLSSVAQAFGTPPVGLARLTAMDASLADRVRKATDTKRSDSDLKSALKGSSSLERMLALTNVLIRFGLHVKGGIVRDYVVRGFVPSSAPDMDVEFHDGAKMTQGNWSSVVDGWARDLTKRFGLASSSPVLGPSGDMVRFDVAVPSTGNVEVEIVMPWNGRYLPPQNMDFSCNNLRLEPGAPTGEIRQTYPIMMKADEIVAQLLQQPKPHTSPTRDCKWTAGGTGTDGQARNMQLDGTTAMMKQRIAKFRQKGFHFVEAPHSSGQNGQRVTLWHGTAIEYVQSIISGGFRPSSSGNLGSGVYLSRDMKIVKQFANYHANGGAVLSAEVDPGKIMHMNGFDSTGSWRNGGFDTAFLSQQHSPRNLEEWCVVNPHRISNIVRIA